MSDTQISFDQATHRAAYLLNHNDFLRRVMVDMVASIVFSARIVDEKQLDSLDECQEVAREIIKKIFLEKGENDAEI